MGTETIIREVSSELKDVELAQALDGQKLDALVGSVAEQEKKLTALSNIVRTNQAYLKAFICVITLIGLQDVVSWLK